MSRARVALYALAVAGCSSNPYVIGRYVSDSGADAGRDARVDAGASPDPCQSAYASSLFCSGFESPELSSEWSSTSTAASGTIERSTVRAHSGAASLHATSDAAESVAVAARSFPALRSGELYMRVYIYVPAGLATETMNIFFLGEAPEPEPPAPFYGIDFNLEDGALQLYSPQWNPARYTGSAAIARDRWVCVRARVAISDTLGAVEVWADDEPALAVSQVDTLPPGGVQRFRAGVDWSSGQTSPFEIYIDDVVLDPTEVGCDP